MRPYKFVHHDRVPAIAPNCASFDLVVLGTKLTRVQKDDIFERCIRENNGYYKVAGWCFPFASYLNTYLVKYDYESRWTEIKAFDKTCIRNNRYLNSGILRIEQIPNK